MHIGDLEEFSTGRELARNALCFFYNICYPAVQPIHEASNRRLTRAHDKTDEPNVLVYPNPAKDQVNFQALNPSIICSDCKILVSDLQGNTIYEAILDPGSGKHIWDTRETASGTYIYQLKTSISVESGKITIIK